MSGSDITVCALRLIKIKDVFHFQYRSDSKLLAEDDNSPKSLLRDKRASLFCVSDEEKCFM